MPTWDIRDAQHGTDMLVRNAALGRHLAAALGKHPAVLMRGHGSTVVAENLPRAVGRAIYLDINARMQYQAIVLAGDDKPIVFMDDAEVAANVSWQNYERSWSLWKAKVLARLAEEAAQNAEPQTELAPFAASAALSDEIQVYDDDINAPREFGLELHVNGTPEGRGIPDYPGEVVPNHGLRMTPEFSYGLTRERGRRGSTCPRASTRRGTVRSPGGNCASNGCRCTATKAAKLVLRRQWRALAPAGEVLESRDSFELRTIGGYRAESWLIAVNPVFGWDLSPGYRSGTPDFSLGVKATHNVAEKVAVGAEYYSEMGKTSHILPLREQANTLYAVVDAAISSSPGASISVSAAGSPARPTSGPSRPSSQSRSNSCQVKNFVSGTSLRCAAGRRFAVGRRGRWTTRHKASSAPPMA